MRISSNLLVQLVDAKDRSDDRLVISNDDTGAEIVIPFAVWPQLAHAITYLTTDFTAHPECRYVQKVIGRTAFGDVTVLQCECGSVAADVDRMVAR